MNYLWAIQQVADTVTNPEAMVNAAIAAKAAELAANQAFYGLVFVIFMLLIIGAMMMFVAYRFERLERNTDGMRERLVDATRKLALIEGNLVGRAEQTEEQAGQLSRAEVAK